MLPTNWCPDWVSIAIKACTRAQAALMWKDMAGTVLSFLARETQTAPAELIVRSSAPEEDIDMRGRFDSKCCSPDCNDLAAKLQAVAYQTADDAAPSTGRHTPVCGPIVQVYIKQDCIGHLSNEYRHAQRSVDFLFEAEFHNAGGGTMNAPVSFRLERPVGPPPTNTPPAVSERPSPRDIEDALRVVASWLAAQNIRALVEWVAHAGQLFVVQLDIDRLPPRVQPMSELPSLRPTTPRSDPWKPAAFRMLTPETDFSGLRKTRSHLLLQNAGAFVPPIYVTANVGLDILDLNSSLWSDLRQLLHTPAVIRFDVPLSRPDWTNLPTIGPVSSIDEAGAKVQTAVRAVQERGIGLDELAVVVHHFIAARASAWSEAQPASPEVRIDAIWGLPDGLQTFVHDSIVCDLSSTITIPHVRYKDRFIDIDATGAWVTRKAYPGLARELACDLGVAREIAELTSRVAASTGRSVRVMWFLDVVQGGGGTTPPAMPWIVVEGETSHGLPPLYIGAAPKAEGLRRLADLHPRKAVANNKDLAVFERNAATMDLGGRYVLFQPDASVVRDRDFLKAFATVVRGLPNQWKVLYAGSVLAHIPYQLQQLGVSVLPLYAEVRRPRRTFSRKLVRDKVPARITAGGEHAEVLELDKGEYLLALRQKLVEEALEVAYATDDEELREELADLLAVAKALVKGSAVHSWEEVEEAEAEKRMRTGGFERRLYLRATGYEPTQAQIIPGAAPVQQLKSRAGVRIPLVPPLLSEDRESRHRIPQLHLDMIVQYREQTVDVVLAPDSDEEAQTQSSRQLSLFDRT